METKNSNMNIIGKRFGRLKIIENSKTKKYYLLCLCDCGNQKEILKYNLTSEQTKSCGCLNKELTSKRSKIIHTKHGLCQHPLYKILKYMKQRCYNKNQKYYKYYGERGIKICLEWLNNSEIFIKWAINNGWKKELEIDRIDNDGNYEPSNCHFVTHSTNQQNKRSFNKLKIKYVRYRYGKYEVNKKINGKSKYFGTYNSLEEAKRVAGKL